MECRHPGAYTDKDFDRLRVWVLFAYVIVLLQQGRHKMLCCGRRNSGLDSIRIAFEPLNLWGRGAPFSFAFSLHPKERKHRHQDYDAESRFQVVVTPTQHGSQRHPSRTNFASVFGKYFYPASSGSQLEARGSLCVLCRVFRACRLVAGASLSCCGTLRPAGAMNPPVPQLVQLRVPPLGLHRRPPLTAGKYALGRDTRRIAFLWLSGLNVAGAVLALRSHSRPDQTPFSQRNRMLQRPREQYASRTGRYGKKKRPNFLLTPADPRVHLTPGRTQEASSVRHEIKNARRPQQLRNILERSQTQGKLDASVLGAAMQRCGHGLWWSELVDVYAMHQQSGIALHCIENNILLHALASCLKCNKTSSAIMERRKQEALEIAKRAWGRPPPTAVAEFNCGLSSALRLCSRIGSDSAYAWADDIWKQSQLQSFPKTIVTYAARMYLCEQRCEYQAVSYLLMQTVRQRQSPDEVVLGGLLQQAAAHFNWKRADDLWQLFLTQHQVKPNFLTYTAYAKAHLLAGRPHMSVRIIEAMLSTGICNMDYKLAIDFAQALLLVCHSSLAPRDMQRLTTFLREGAKILAKESAPSGKDCWQELTSRAENLMTDHSSVAFADLLITMNARELSVMKSWPNYPPGSGYLKTHLAPKQSCAVTLRGLPPSDV